MEGFFCGAPFLFLLFSEYCFLSQGIYFDLVVVNIVNGTYFNYC